MKKPKIKMNMRITLGVFVALFVTLIGYLGYSVAVYGQTWFSMPYNPRIAEARQDVEAGVIYDRNGVKLAWTDDGDRRYAEDEDTRRAVSHTVGDIYGKTLGAETYFAKYLYGYDKSTMERLNLAASGEDLSGSDVKLTIDSKLCRYIYNHMDFDGAVVVMDYTTGEILASVSKPTFDPEALSEDEGADGKEGSEYVNRATMGKYPPGSTMKIITAAAALENGITQDWDCSGSAIIEGQRITCPKEDGHGEEDLESAFIHSCNTYFGMLATKIGGNTLLSFADKFMFNTEFSFDDFMLYSSNFENSSNKGDIAWAGIGQYNDLVTPMHNAMIAASIGNNGSMMEPKLLKDVLHNGNSVYNFTPAVLTNVLDAGTVATLKEYMRLVVEEGTATSAQIDDVSLCGKTGTAEFVKDGEIANHSWFVGFIEDAGHPLAVSVVLEGAGYGSAYAAPLAGDVLSRAMDLGY